MTIKKPVALVAGIVLLLAGIAPVAALADHVDPDLIPGNPNCQNVLPGSTEFKIEPVPGGNTNHSDGTLAVTLSVYNVAQGQVFDFTANPAVAGVIVKGGPNANFYNYQPGGSTGDTALHAPIHPPGSGTYAGLSHISFCYFEQPDDPEGTLSVEKSAAGRYDRTVTWELEKSVDPDSHSGVAGEVAGESDWTVVATKTEVSDNYQVSGTIAVSWTGEYAVTVDVTDSLPGASIDCGDGTATIAFPAAPDTESCSYSVATDGEVAQNTATATPVAPPFPTNPASDTATIGWTENLTGDDEVDLDDERFEHSETINSSTTEVFPETFTCPDDTSLYVDGVHQYTEDNLATLTGDNTDLEADASVVVTCVLEELEGEKTAEGSYDRTVEWELDKTVDPDSHSGGPGDVFASDWTVTATKIDSGPQNFSVSGTVTVNNDAAIEQTFTVTDELDDGTVADVDCGAGTNSATVPAGGSVECDYEAFPADASATLNTATISAPGNENVIVTAPVAFTENLTGDDEVDLLDLEGPLDETLTGSEEFVYEGTFECPAEDSDLYVDGELTFEVLNVALLIGDNTDLEAEATVTVDCILDEVLGEVIEEVEEEDEPDEVLGVVRTATTTLPRTGASTLLLILLGLSAFGTGTTLVRRRR